MDERRDPPGEPGSRPAAILAGVGQLSPVQLAYGKYAKHFLGCFDCRDIDRQCMVGERLWRAYREQDAEACRRLNETP